MRSDLLADYLLNEYLPLHPSCDKQELLEVFKAKAAGLSLDSADAQLLLEAFTHKSFAHESKLDLKNNERLEFLGDSVLQLLVSQKLMEMYPATKEGKLSKLRSSIVNEAALGEVAMVLGLHKLLLLGRGELLEKGYEKSSLLANCFEAFLGAVYLSRGLKGAKEILNEIFCKHSEKSGKDLFLLEAIETFDAKSRLQERLMKDFHEPPRYQCEEESLKKEKVFRISLFIQDKKLGELVHRSKKKGMQELAKIVLSERYQD